MAVRVTKRAILDGASEVHVLRVESDLVTGSARQTVVTVDTKSSTHWSLGINKEEENIIHALQKKYQIHGHEVYTAHKPVRECKK
jgi:deoxycytidylate deaminase